MAYEKMIFKVTDDIMEARLGGLPILDDRVAWPTDPETGEQLLLLASLPASFWLKTNIGALLPAQCCLSIFMKHPQGDRKAVRRMTVHEDSQLPNISSAPVKVLIHRTADSIRPDGVVGAIYPMLTIGLEAHSEVDRDPEMTDRGTTFSKVGGVPGWGQDEIHVPDHIFALQLEEFEIGRACAGWFEVFGGGVGFLFVQCKEGIIESGVFFVQFT